MIRVSPFEFLIPNRDDRGGGINSRAGRHGHSKYRDKVAQFKSNRGDFSNRTRRQECAVFRRGLRRCQGRQQHKRAGLVHRVQRKRLGERASPDGELLADTRKDPRTRAERVCLDRPVYTRASSLRVLRGPRFLAILLVRNARRKRAWLRCRLLLFVTPSPGQPIASEFLERIAIKIPSNLVFLLETSGSRLHPLIFIHF